MLSITTIFFGVLVAAVCVIIFCLFKIAQAYVENRRDEREWYQDHYGDDYDAEYEDEGGYDEYPESYDSYQEAPAQYPVPNVRIVHNQPLEGLPASDTLADMYAELTSENLCPFCERDHVGECEYMNEVSDITEIIVPTAVWLPPQDEVPDEDDWTWHHGTFNAPTELLEDLRAECGESDWLYQLLRVPHQTAHFVDTDSIPMPALVG